LVRALQKGLGMKTTLWAMLAVLSLASVGAAAAAKPAKAPVKQVAISVTADGFQPAEVRTKAGQPLRLVVTRTTERTCATELVIKDLGITKALPLGQPVTIDLQPTKDGRLRYACGMDMIAGVIVVE
jgi:plastocyanin domain-containing protein